MSSTRKNGTKLIDTTQTAVRSTGTYRPSDTSDDFGGFCRFIRESARRSFGVVAGALRGMSGVLLWTTEKGTDSTLVVTRQVPRRKGPFATPPKHFLRPLHIGLSGTSGTSVRLGIQPRARRSLQRIYGRQPPEAPRFPRILEAAGC